jgi:hypothetical protein
VFDDCARFGIVRSLINAGGRLLCMYWWHVAVCIKLHCVLWHREEPHQRRWATGCRRRLNVYNRSVSIAAHHHLLLTTYQPAFVHYPHSVYDANLLLRSMTTALLPHPAHTLLTLPLRMLAVIAAIALVLSNALHTLHSTPPSADEINLRLSSIAAHLLWLCS